MEKKTAQKINIFLRHLKILVIHKTHPSRKEGKKKERKKERERKKEKCKGELRRKETYIRSLVSFQTSTRTFTTTG